MEEYHSARDVRGIDNLAYLECLKRLYMVLYYGSNLILYKFDAMCHFLPKGFVRKIKTMTTNVTRDKFIREMKSLKEGSNSDII